MPTNMLLTLSTLLATLLLAGCPASSTNTPSTPTGQTTTTKTDHDEHDHGHDHEHSHGKGPNGGSIFDLGAHHAEVTFDHPTNKVQIVFLEGDNEKAQPRSVAATELTLNTKEARTSDGTVIAPLTITLTPADAADGKASTFTGTDPGLASVANYSGTVIGEIDGKPAQGEFTSRTE